MNSISLRITKLKTQSDIENAGSEQLQVSDLYIRYREFEKIVEERTGRRVRKDAVRILLLTIEIKSDEERPNTAFLDQFAAKTFAGGESSCILETNWSAPDYYIAVVPLTTDGFISAYSYLKNPAALRNIQRQFAETVKETGYAVTGSVSNHAQTNTPARVSSTIKTKTKEARLQQKIKDLQKENKMLQKQMQDYLSLLEDSGGLRRLRELSQKGAAFENACRQLPPDQAEQLTGLVSSLDQQYKKNREVELCLSSK